MGEFKTCEFKTKSEIMPVKMPRINGNNQYKAKTILGIDGGYSSVKGVSPNKVFLFPSYAKRLTKDIEAVSKLSDTHIQFRNNKTGEMWLVGQSAEALMNQNDISSTTDASLYTRYRYKSDVFKVIMTTGMCIGLMNTDMSNEIYLQTGLPAEYKERDEKSLIAALCDTYDVSIKIGNGEWMAFEFVLDENHISVMEQPKGTLCAIAYKDGELTDLGKDVMFSNALIYDVGFGTEDIFSILNRVKNSSVTYSDTGMKAVFEAVIAEITRKNPVDIKIFEFQKYLEDGIVKYLDNEEYVIKKISFADILKKVNSEMCQKSMVRLLQEFNITDYKYFIVTGGTGESRYKQIEDFFKARKLDDIKIIPGNLNTPNLPFMYANVVGYYMFRHAKIASECKKAG